MVQYQQSPEPDPYGQRGPELGGYQPPPAAPAPVYPAAQEPPSYGYGYGHQQYPPQYLPQPHPVYQPVLADHPSSTTVLVLGVAGLFMPVLSPIAWYLGHKAKGEVRRGAPYQWGVAGQVGYFLGIAITMFMVLAVLMFVGLVAAA